MKDISDRLEIFRRGSVGIIEEKEFSEKLSSGRQLRIKFGADPTAPDIHLGHTVVLSKLRQFQDQGHKVVFIIGDFTARIGDPSGRNQMRPALSREEIEKNALTYQEQIFKILDNDPARIEVVYNSVWLEKLGVDGLMKLASHYTVARMLEREDFRERYKNGAPISVLEFLYPLLQGYDSVYLKSDVEVGGADQIFNLLVGREIQRAYGLEPQSLLTVPLLEGTDGTKKMSKSAGNYIGLTEEPREMFGKIMSISDELMYKYYLLLTNEDIDEIKNIHPMEAKKRLASFLVKKYHGETGAQVASRYFEETFVKKEIPETVAEVSMPAGKYPVVDFVLKAGLDVSKTELKRLMSQRAVEIDGRLIDNFREEIEFGREIILRVGKKTLLKVVPRS
ncbi:MAG TPA: tyrosine--tRNA ligase [bacterium]|nr:tyrosine--tRNA ligase [bacterium]